MAGRKGNKKHANKTSFTSSAMKGNKNAQIWAEKSVRELFQVMRDNAENDKEILCLQDAIRSVQLYSSSLNYLLEKFPEFENLKKDIQNAIVSRVNKEALKGNFHATASIWRMKQLGEKDQSEVKQDLTTLGKAITNEKTVIEFINAKEKK
jgi:hypothetical protein